MYLHNSKTRELSPFLYGMRYDATTRAVEFLLNPWCISVFKEMNKETLVLQYCEKLGYIHPELDIEKNFGFNECSVNKGMVNGLVTLSFPLKALFTLSNKKCSACRGKKVGWNDTLCYFCRGSGYEFLKKSNTVSICTTLYLLTRYLNWTCFLDKDRPIPENKWGQQHLFIELDATAGIGGECSKELFGFLSKLPDGYQEKIQKDMFDLYMIIEGKDRFPEFEFYTRVQQFRCKIANTGRFYLEVPGQNGCSIHMDHYANTTQFTCHNVDVPQQQLCLVAGLASIVGGVYI